MWPQRRAGGSSGDLTCIYRQKHMSRFLVAWPVEYHSGGSNIGRPQVRQSSLAAGCRGGDKADRGRRARGQQAWG